MIFAGALAFGLWLGLAQASAEGFAAWDTGAGARYHSYTEIVDELQRLERVYPQYVDLYDAQSRFGLGHPGATPSNPAPRICDGIPCRQWIVRITNEDTLNADATAINGGSGERPEVFFSGALHGNEQIGPNAVIDLVTLLVENRARARRRAPDDAWDPWLVRLVDTRALFFMPMTNAWGYANNRRGEINPALPYDEMDPNRDFPYDVLSPTECMRTVTARAVNELYRRHAFQLAVTFHGGMRAIAWNWGGCNHPGTAIGGCITRRGDSTAPDEVAQSQVATAMQAFGGRFNDGYGRFYPRGRLNDIVYGVHGGMEDWGYGSSWEAGMLPRTGCTAGEGATPPYSRQRTSEALYPPAAARAFTILVETDDLKRPPESSLAGHNGHVARNMRLALAVADIVEPYVSWTTRLTPPAGAPSAPAALAIALDGGGAGVQLRWRGDDLQHLGLQVDVAWRVGGAFHVDETQLLWAPRAKVSPLDQGVQGGGATDFNTDSDAAAALVAWSRNCTVASSAACKQIFAHLGGASQVRAGDAAWASVGNDPDKYTTRSAFAANANGDGLGGLPFAGSTFWATTKWVWPGRALSDLDVLLVPAASVDSSWQTPVANAQPAVSPQSHIANARTNPTWDYTSGVPNTNEGGGSRVRGRQRWFGDALSLRARVAPLHWGKTRLGSCAHALGNIHQMSQISPSDRVTCACACVTAEPRTAAIREAISCNPTVFMPKPFLVYEAGPTAEPFDVKADAQPLENLTEYGRRVVCTKICDAQSTTRDDDSISTTTPSAPLPSASGVDDHTTTPHSMNITMNRSGCSGSGSIYTVRSTNASTAGISTVLKVVMAVLSTLVVGGLIIGIACLRRKRMSNYGVVTSGNRAESGDAVALRPGDRDVQWGDDSITADADWGPDVEAEHGEMDVEVDLRGDGDGRVVAESARVNTIKI